MASKSKDYKRMDGGRGARPIRRTLMTHTQHSSLNVKGVNTRALLKHQNDIDLFKIPQV